MGLIDFPNPGDWVNSIKDGNLQREAEKSIISAAYSSYITGLWSSGSSKWAQWLGEGKAMQDMATSTYLSLRPLERQGFFVLTVPHDLLEADNLSRFQTEYKP